MKAVLFKAIRQFLKKIKQPGSSIVAILVVFVMVFALAAPAMPAAAETGVSSAGTAAADGTGKSNASNTSKDDSANASAESSTGNDNSSGTDTGSAGGLAQSGSSGTGSTQAGNGSTDGNQGSAEFVIDTETDKSLSGAAGTNGADSAGDTAQSDTSGTGTAGGTQSSSLSGTGSTDGADGNSQPGSSSDLQEEMVIETVTSPAQAEGLDAAPETMTIDGTEYHPFASLTIHPGSDHAYVGDDIELEVSFTMEDLAQANFYGEIPYDPQKIDYSLASGKITLNGEEAGNYAVKIAENKAYLCISLDHDHAAGSAGNGTFAMTAKATGAGEIHFDNEVITIHDPSDEKYDNISITKSAIGPQPVVSGEHQGEYLYSYEVIFKNNHTERIDNLTVFDCPNYMNNASTYKDGAWPSWPEDTTRIDLQYPQTLPGNGNNYTMTLTASPDKMDGTSRRYNEYQCTGVSIDPGQELKWTYEVYLTAAEAAKVERLQKTAYWTNYAGFRVGNQKIKEVSRLVSFTPDTTPMTKIGALPKEEGGDMEWTIALETKGSYNAAGKYISDHLKKDAVSEGDDLHFILDNTGAEQPFAIVYRNGVKQDGKVMLTWEQVADATKLTSGDPAKLYYDEAGNFIWFSEEQTDANYGYELHYWTNFKSEWMGLDSINQAASNFSDKTMAGIDGDYEADISLTKKLLLYDENNRSADWEINVPVYLTHPVSNVYLRDYLPTTTRSARQDNLRDTMDFMNQIHVGDTAGGNLIYTQDETAAVTNTSNESFRLVHRYWEFNSVADFEAFTGIQIEVTGTLGAGIQSTGTADADAVLCSHGKLGFYASTYLYESNGKPAGGLWFIYPNAVTASNTSISSSGMRNLASTLPEGDYDIRLNYRSTTPATCEKDETNINYVFLNGTTALGNNFSLNAYAAYYMYPTRDGAESIDKKIAKVERKANGKIDITYMVLADNRSTKYTGTTIRTTNTYDDFLSGLPTGAAKLVIPDPGKRDGVRIYKIPVTYNPNDPTGWTLREAHSLEELEKSENGYELITDPLTDRNGISGEWWGGITRERMDENGFNFYIPYSWNISQSKGYAYDSGYWGMRAVRHVYDFAPGYEIDWSKYAEVDDFYNNYDFSKMTKSSFYFVYTVEVDEEKLNQNDILRNTINRYTGNSMTGSSYQDYAILLNELRKNITDKPTAKNNYTVSYQLDIKMTEKLKALDTYTITDKLSDNQELDVQTLRIYQVNADGTETLLPAQPPADGNGAYYTSMYTDHNLVIAMNKGEEDWADQYAVRYEAYLTDYEGRVQYDNEARIPDGEDIPHSTEGEVFVKRPEGQVTNLEVEIYKYDGNNTAQSLAGAKFKLLQLSAEKQAELKALAGESSTTQETIDRYLAGLSDSDWIQFGEEKTTGADGKAGFGTWRDSAGDAHSILYNHVYKLQETEVPAGYSDAQLKTQYFMFYTTNYPSHTDVDGVEKFVRSFAPDKASLLIPNYKTSFRVYKVDAQKTDQKLTGVRFGLYANAACTQEIQNYKYPNGQPAAEGYLYYPDIPVPVSGTATYYLKEIQAPESYLLDPNRVFVVNVTSEGRITFEEKVWVKNEEDEAGGTLRDLTDGETPAKISADAIGITIANKPNKTTFEFNKEWLFGTEKKPWPDEVKEITVTLTRTCQPAGKDKVTQSVTFKVPKVLTGEINLKEITGSQISGKVTQTAAGTDNNYTYKITDLEDVAFGNTAEKDNAVKWSYTITEAQVDGYEMPKYIPKGDTEPAKDAKSVGSGGTIRNEQSGTELPSTGGPGTTVIYLLGVLLVIAGGLWKVISHKQIV